MIANANNWFSLFGQKIPLDWLHFGWIAGLGLLLLLAAYLLYAKMLSELTGEPLRKMFPKPVICLIGTAAICYVLFFLLSLFASIQAESARRKIQDRFGRYPSVGGFNEIYFAGQKQDKVFWDYLEKVMESHRNGMFKVPDGKTNALYEISPCHFLELTGEEKRMFRNNLAKVSSSLAKLDETLKGGIPKFPLEVKKNQVFNTLLPQLNIMRSFCRQMEWRTYMALEAGNMAEASRISEFTREMAQYGENEVFLIGTLVGIACYNIYFDSIEQLVEKHALTREQIRMISQELIALEKRFPQIEKNTLFSEAVGGNDLFGSILSGDIQKIRYEEVIRVIPIRSLPFFLPQFQWLLLRNQTSYLRFYDAENFETIPDVRKEEMTPSNKMADLLIPSLKSAGKKFRQLIARNRAERVILACELFRMDTGKYPTSASELVPKYLDKIPDDPFTGKPLLFRAGKIKVGAGKIVEKNKAIRIVDEPKEIEGIQVWSIGPNGKDEGGQRDNMKHQDDTRAVIRTP